MALNYSLFKRINEYLSSIEFYTEHEPELEQFNQILNNLKQEFKNIKDQNLTTTTKVQKMMESFNLTDVSYKVYETKLLLKINIPKTPNETLSRSKSIKSSIKRIKKITVYDLYDFHKVEFEISLNKNITAEKLYDKITTGINMVKEALEE